MFIYYSLYALQVIINCLGLVLSIVADDGDGRLFLGSGYNCGAIYRSAIEMKGVCI